MAFCSTTSLNLPFQVGYLVNKLQVKDNINSKLSFGTMQQTLHRQPLIHAQETKTRTNFLSSFIQQFASRVLINSKITCSGISISFMVLQNFQEIFKCIIHICHVNFLALSMFVSGCRRVGKSRLRNPGVVNRCVWLI